MLVYLTLELKFYLIAVIRFAVTCDVAVSYHSCTRTSNSIAAQHALRLILKDMLIHMLIPMHWDLALGGCKNKSNRKPLKRGCNTCFWFLLCITFLCSTAIRESAKMMYLQTTNRADFTRHRDSEYTSEKGRRIMKTMDGGNGM